MFSSNWIVFLIVQISSYCPTDRICFQDSLSSTTSHFRSPLRRSSLMAGERNFQFFEKYADKNFKFSFWLGGGEWTLEKQNLISLTTSRSRSPLRRSSLMTGKEKFQSGLFILLAYLCVRRPKVGPKNKGLRNANDLTFSTQAGAKINHGRMVDI